MINDRRDGFALAALILFILAAIGAFASNFMSHEAETGLAYAGLACLIVAGWRRP